MNIKHLLLCAGVFSFAQNLVPAHRIWDLIKPKKDSIAMSAAFLNLCHGTSNMFEERTDTTGAIIDVVGAVTPMVAEVYEQHQLAILLALINTYRIADKYRKKINERDQIIENMIADPEFRSDVAYQAMYAADLEKHQETLIKIKGVMQNMKRNLEEAKKEINRLNKSA